jgi:hypothetical protein
MSGVENIHVRAAASSSCPITRLARSKIRMNDTGPLAVPWVLCTTSPAGRRWEKEKPVPPPAW